MTYTPDQILAAIHSGDTGLARYYLSALDADDLRAIAFTFATRVPEPLPEPETPEQLIASAVARAAAAFATTPAEVLSASRHREPTDARQVVAYVARLHGMSLKTIGSHLYRDHTTIMSSISRVAETPRLRRIATSIAESTGWDRERDVA